MLRGWIAAQRWRRLLDTPNTRLPIQRRSGANSPISGPATYQGQGRNIRGYGDTEIRKSDDLGKLMPPEVVSFRIPLSPYSRIPAHCTGTDGSIQNTSQWCPSGS